VSEWSRATPVDTAWGRIAPLAAGASR
jgi:hypothetical protein